jgi:hypothetical protein
MANDLTALAGAAMTEKLNNVLRQHLVRADGQEDLCFALYWPSQGKRRFTALLSDALLPEDGDRQVHYNASFNPAYLERILARAADVGAGVAFLHSHPRGIGWQSMSPDDVDAEAGMAAAVRSATGLPLVGLTLSGKTGFWSARQWHRVRRHVWEPLDCESVRVVGLALCPSFCPGSKPLVSFPVALTRTVHAWGDAVQRQLARLRISIVGLGSVGSIIAEELTRMGFSEVVGIDFDLIKEHNRDRTLHAYPENVATSDLKVSMAARNAVRSSTMPGFTFQSVPLGIQELEAYRAALDCDVIFSCVDRPWPRSILNHIAYAHLIPIIDGGIAVTLKADGSLRSADWGAFVAGPQRRCLECAGQFSSGLVAVEQQGDLDDPEYIKSLPADSPLRKNENVFAFSLALAAMEVLKLVQLVGRPGGIEAPMEERYVYPAGNVEIEREAECSGNCSYKTMTGLGESAGHPGTAEWP